MRSRTARLAVEVNLAEVGLAAAAADALFEFLVSGGKNVEALAEFHELTTSINAIEVLA